MWRIWLMRSRGYSPQERAWKLLLRALVVGLLIAPLLFFLLGKIRFFEGFFGLDIHLESLLAAYSTRHDTPALRERIALVVIDADFSTPDSASGRMIRPRGENIMQT